MDPPGRRADGGNGHQVLQRHWALILCVAEFSFSDRLDSIEFECHFFISFLMFGHTKSSAMSLSIALRPGWENEWKCSKILFLMLVGTRGL